jgi:predicted transcriptional regulator
MSKVKDLMVSEVVTIDDSASIVGAAKRMIQEKEGPLPVVEEGDRIHVIVTDRDIIAHVVAEGRDPSALRVHDIATHELVTIGPEQDVDDARRLAQAELETLTRRQEHIEQLEKDRESLLKSMAEIVSDALEDLTPQERNKMYRMLRLEATPSEKGYQVSGAFCSSRLTSP